MLILRWPLIIYSKRCAEDEGFRIVPRIPWRDNLHKHRRMTPVFDLPTSKWRCHRTLFPSLEDLICRPTRGFHAMLIPCFPMSCRLSMIPTQCISIFAYFQPTGYGVTCGQAKPCILPSLSYLQRRPVSVRHAPVFT